jgi:hypothetical protein
MQPQDSTATVKTLTFPAAGIDVSAAFCRQKPKQITGNTNAVQQNPVSGAPIVGGFDVQGMQADPHMWAATTVLGVNVRGYDTQQNKRRGGTRNGLSQYIPAQAAGVPWVIQNLNYIVETTG